LFPPEPEHQTAGEGPRVGRRHGLNVGRPFLLWLLGERLKAARDEACQRLAGGNERPWFPLREERERERERERRSWNYALFALPIRIGESDAAGALLRLLARA